VDVSIPVDRELAGALEFMAARSAEVQMPARGDALGLRERLDE
jgi:hypothetical protein